MLADINEPVEIIQITMPQMIKILSRSTRLMVNHRIQNTSHLLLKALAAQRKIEILLPEKKTLGK